MLKRMRTKNDYLRINDTYSPVLVVVNTSYEIVKKCQNITGVGTIRTIKPEKSHHKIKYDWRVSSNQCKSVVEEIYPYLVAKQHQARLILGILNEKTHIGLIDLHHDRKM